MTLLALTRVRLLLLAWLVSLTGCAAWAVSSARPAITRGPYLQDGSAAAIVVRWRTPAPGQGRVEYQAEGATAPRVAYSGDGPDHRARLVGLAAGKRYHYRLFAGATALGGDYAFVSAKPPGTPFRFLVFGDSGDGGKAQYAVAARMTREEADFVLHTGDVIYPFGEERHYDRNFFGPYAPMLSRMVFWMSLGNHDAVPKDASPYFHNFDLPANGPAGLKPGHHYSFDYGGARFVALDSNAGPAVLERRVAPWLERTLAAAPTPTWRFVFFHHPPYSDGLHGGSPVIRRALVPAFQRAHVDVVFCGHDHDYQRTTPIDGVIYIVSGGGGAPLYPRRRHSPTTAKFYTKRHGFVVAQINGDALALRYINTAGETVDSATLRKP
jgi:Calcineurin-like phosphoesterase